MAEQFVWTAADGSSITLTDETAGYSVLANGTSGLRSVTYEMTTNRYATIDGSTVQAIYAAPNEPTLGLMLQANSESEFRTKARQLVRLMRPKAGPGTLTVANETGERRSLACYCVAGLEGDHAVDVTLPGSWWRMLLRFYAPDPWWSGPLQSVNFGLGAPTTFFPIFPLVLSSSTVQGQFTVDLSDMDAPSYPVWTITGPGSGLVLTNESTGRQIQVNAELAADETMVIDTRPGLQSIRRGDGVSLMSALASDPALWPLIEGVNVVTAALTDATAASRITGVFAPKYAGI